MKRTRHSPEQIVPKLRDADAMLSTDATIGQVCQKLSVSEPTFHRWRNQYGGMKASEAKRLKELEIENARLKKLVGGPVAGQRDAQGGGQGGMVSPARRREAVARLRA